MDQYLVPLAAIVVAVIAFGYWLNHRRHTGIARQWCDDCGHAGEE